MAVAKKPPFEAGKGAARASAKLSRMAQIAQLAWLKAVFGTKRVRASMFFALEIILRLIPE